MGPVFASVALLLAAAPAAAEPAAGQGVGAYTCAEAARAARDDHQLDLIYFSWAQGWMTGWNLAQLDQHQPTADMTALSLPDQRAFLENYCARHADGLYMEAVYKLYQAMKPSGK
jgi:hypothetical protein